ncbi:MAG TPA: biotin/lipoyl-containing protein, partial [Acidimicrobiales bacterium]
AGAAPAAPAAPDGGDERVLREVTAEVDGRRYQLKLWVPDTGVALVAGGGAAKAAGPKRRGGGHVAAAAGSGTVMVPMQGTIVKVLVAVGDAVDAGQTICVLEAMKMENAINAETAGTVKEIRVAAGDSVGSGDVVAVIE